MKNRAGLDIGPSMGDRENGRSSRKPRGLRMNKKRQTVQALWCGFKLGNMGANSEDEVGGASDGHIRKDLTCQAREFLKASSRPWQTVWKRIK